MGSFNLVHQRWIPVVRGDGTPTELSLCDTLTQAHELRELFDPSPLVTAALHRLLLAVLYEVFDPRTEDDWLKLWREKSFSAARLDAYFTAQIAGGDVRSDRFDLFHPTRPFYQTPGVTLRDPSPCWRLAHEVASGNNPTLLDHSFDASPRPMSSAAAARYLVAQHAAGLGGTGKPFNFEDGPLLLGYMTFVTGTSLRQTLLLSLLPAEELVLRGAPGRTKDDAPAWEADRPLPSVRTPRQLEGYVDYLTWQSRLVRIEGDPEDGGTVHIRQGYVIDEPLIDPFFQHVAPSVDWKRRYRPARRLGTERAVWRDSHALLQWSDTSDERPGTVGWVATAKRLLENDGLPMPDTRLAIIGLAKTKAATVLWRYERLPLPSRFLDDRALVDRLGFALRDAEQVADDLWTVARHIAWWCLHPTAIRLPENKDFQREAKAKGRLDRLAQRFSLRRRYWARLGAAFPALMTQLAAERESGTDRSNASRQWAWAIEAASNTAFDEVTAELNGTIRGLRAAVAPRRLFEVRRTVVLQRLRDLPPPVPE